MTVHISIQGADAFDAMHQMQALLGGSAPFNATKSAPPIDDSDEGEDDETTSGETAGSEATAAPKTPGKRGRPRKTATETTPVVTTTAEPVVAAAAETAPVAEPAAEVVVPPAAAAQDAADEAAESAPKPEAPKTTEDVRTAMAAYMARYGMPAAQADLSRVWTNAGIVAEKVSNITDPADCAKAVAAITAAIDGNPFGRDAVTPAA